MRHSLIEEGQHLLLSRRIAPVAHQLAGDCEHRQDLYTRRTHAVVGILRGLHVECARGVAIREDAVALGSEG